MKILSLSFFCSPSCCFGRRAFYLPFFPPAFTLCTSSSWGEMHDGCSVNPATRGASANIYLFLISLEIELLKSISRYKYSGWSQRSARDWQADGMRASPRRNKEDVEGRWSFYFTLKKDYFLSNNTEKVNIIPSL